MINFIWPVPGFYRVSSGFKTAERPRHMGIDIGRNLHPPKTIDGACIVAVACGVVTRVVPNSASAGNWVEIDHGVGWVSRYMHNQANLVKLGQSIVQGEVIALVGNTGNSTGPHLHIELLLHGVHVDPAKYLNQHLGVFSDLENTGFGGGEAPHPARGDYVRLLFGALARFFSR